MKTKTSFERAITAFGPRERSEIERLLRDWAKGPVGVSVAPNVRDREHFLPKRFMRSLLEVVLANAADLDRLQEQFKYACHGTVKLTLREQAGAAGVTSRFESRRARDGVPSEERATP